MNYERIESKQLRAKVVASQQAALLIKDGMTVATSGFAAAGYPKAVLHALAERVRSGDELRLNFVNSSNLGTEIEAELAETGIVKRLSPFQMTRACAQLINKGRIDYVEMPLSRVAPAVRDGSLGEIDIAIIEALRITPQGELVLTSGVGLSPLFVQQAKQIIIEINTSQPVELDGMHDIFCPGTGPGKPPIPLQGIAQRIGSTTLAVDPEKVAAVVVTDDSGVEVLYAAPDKLVGKFADNLFNFLELEYVRKSRRLPPLQSGIGNMANNLVRAFGRTNFKDIEFFCGLLQEANVELLAKGQAVCASGSAVHTTKRVRELFASDPQGFQKMITLRSIELTNCAELIDRMQPIALNSAVEIDLYGNANLSHVMGSQVVNGTGGGTTFAHNAGLSVMLLPSIGKGGDLSNIVPKVTVQDISSHYIDIIITDIGVADLRGKTPIEKAEAIIANCVSPIYKAALTSYLAESKHKIGGHEPQLLAECFKWHQQFQETGSMKPI